MYCKKCGAPIPDGQDLCPNCQSEETKIEITPETPETLETPETPVTPEIPDTPAEPEQFQLNVPQEEPVKKSGGKKTALLAVGAAVIVALLGVVIAWACGAFSSPRQQLLHAEKAEAKAASSAISQAYGAYVDSLGNAPSMEDGFSIQADYRLSLSDQLLVPFLSAAFETDMSAADLSWLEHLLIHADMAGKDSQMDMSLGIGLNDKVVVSVKMLMDSAKQSVAIGLPELSSQYLGTVLGYTGISPDVMKQAISIVAELAEDLPDQSAVEEMVNRYYDIYLSKIENVEKSTETVTVGDLSKNVTVLKHTITEEQLAGMCKEILTTAKTDKTIKQFIEAVDNYFNSANRRASGNLGIAAPRQDAYSAFLDSLDDALEDIEDAKDSFDPENYVVLSTYLDKNDIIGRKLEVFSADDAPKAMHYLTLTEKDGYRLEVVIDNVTVLGKGEGDTGEYTLEVDGEEMLKLQAEGLVYTSETSSGTIRLYPRKALLEELGINGSYASLVELGECYMEIQLNGNQENGSVKYSLMVGGEAMVSLQVDGTTRKEAQITMPETVLDPNSEADVTAWVRNLNFDTVISNLKAANVPSEYVDAVRQLISSLSTQLSQAA